ncbi:hypothetical protein P43SY_006012 [Pythium insidiosum]|uniref:Tubby C-terminal domain-containing protein n=1 Tax=Pythium insidiosum TaxID=114742 RepID=A0AAD5Q9A5_PYTIN|nr:hypothetical protein P43SY_006012 [Pythium insidiosum]
MWGVAVGVALMLSGVVLIAIGSQSLDAGMTRREELVRASLIVDAATTPLPFLNSSTWGVAMTGDPVYLSFYLWNLTNGPAILRGLESPKAEQIGPYTYEKSARKVDVAFTKAESDGSSQYVSYRVDSTYRFVQARSNGTEQDIVVTMNATYARRLAKLRATGYSERFLVAEFAQQHLQQYHQHLHAAQLPTLETAQYLWQKDNMYSFLNTEEDTGQFPIGFYAWREMADATTCNVSQNLAFVLWNHSSSASFLHPSGASEWLAFAQMDSRNTTQFLRRISSLDAVVAEIAAGNDTNVPCSIDAVAYWISSWRRHPYTVQLVDSLWIQGAEPPVYPMLYFDYPSEFVRAFPLSRASKVPAGLRSAQTVQFLADVIAPTLLGESESLAFANLTFGFPVWHVEMSALPLRQFTNASVTAINYTVPAPMPPDFEEHIGTVSERIARPLLVFDLPSHTVSKVNDTATTSGFGELAAFCQWNRHDEVFAYDAYEPCSLGLDDPVSMTSAARLLSTFGDATKVNMPNSTLQTTRGAILIDAFLGQPFSSSESCSQAMQNLAQVLELTPAVRLAACHSSANGIVLDLPLLTAMDLPPSAFPRVKAIQAYLKYAATKFIFEPSVVGLRPRVLTMPEILDSPSGDASQRDTLPLGGYLAAQTVGQALSCEQMSSCLWQTAASTETPRLTFETPSSRADPNVLLRKDQSVGQIVAIDGATTVTMWGERFRMSDMHATDGTQFTTAVFSARQFMAEKDDFPPPKLLFYWEYPHRIAQAEFSRNVTRFGIPLMRYTIKSWQQPSGIPDGLEMTLAQQQATTNAPSGAVNVYHRRLVWQLSSWLSQDRLHRDVWHVNLTEAWLPVLWVREVHSVSPSDAATFVSSAVSPSPFSKEKLAMWGVVGGTVYLALGAVVASFYGRRARTMMRIRKGQAVMPAGVGVSPTLISTDGSKLDDRADAPVGGNWSADNSFESIAKHLHGTSGVTTSSTGRRMSASAWPRKRSLPPSIHTIEERGEALDDAAEDVQKAYYAGSIPGRAPFVVGVFFFLVVSEHRSGRRDGCNTAMAHRATAMSAYDRMMAELQPDSSDEEPARCADAKTLTAPRPDKSAAWAEKPRSVDAGRRPGPSRNASTASEAKLQSSRADAKLDADGDSQRRPDVVAETPRRRRSFPPLPTRAPSHHSSKSHNSDGGEESGSSDSGGDASDQEREARVRPAASDAFGAAQSPPAARRQLQLHAEPQALRAFLVNAPRAGAATIKCVVRRDRQGLHRLHPIYRLYLEDGDRFLLSAQKRSSSKTSNYLLTMAQQPSDRRSALIVGKLRANWSGSEYVVFDAGLSPAATALDANVRAVLALIEFAYDEMGPGQLNVRLPPVPDSGVGLDTWRDPDLDKPSAARQAFEERVDRRALLLRTVRPHFDARTGNHMLDFRGRVSMPSIKNFQLQCDAHHEAPPVLQFGRVSCQPPGPRAQCKCHKDTFVMDVRHPLSPLQAFAICLATLDSKIAAAKVFDSVTKLIKKR